MVVLLAIIVAWFAANMSPAFPCTRGESLVPLPDYERERLGFASHAPLSSVEPTAAASLTSCALGVGGGLSTRDFSANFSNASS